MDDTMQKQIQVEVKGMWFKVLDSEDIVSEIILPIRTTVKKIKEEYLTDVEILDQHIVEQIFEIPYSTLVNDGFVKTKHYNTKFVNERDSTD